MHARARCYGSVQGGAWFGFGKTAWALIDSSGVRVTTTTIFSNMKGKCRHSSEVTCWKGIRP